MRKIFATKINWHRRSFNCERKLNETCARNSRIYSLSDPGKSILPSQNALKLMYKRQRIAPQIPQTVEELELYGSDIQTMSNKSFLSYDSGPDPDRIVMFGTRENLDFLETTNIWLANGMFNFFPVNLLNIKIFVLQPRKVYEHIGVRYEFKFLYFDHF